MSERFLCGKGIAGGMDNSQLVLSGILQKDLEKFPAGEALDNCALNAALVVRFRSEIFINGLVLENSSSVSEVILQWVLQTLFAGR